MLPRHKCEPWRRQQNLLGFLLPVLLHFLPLSESFDDVEPAEADVATWNEILVTTFFTLITSAVFLVVFEFSRRNPAVSAVFDRRRPTKPSRTPPPLMRKRYFEWIFLSTDPAYSEYADVSDRKARGRREERRLERTTTTTTDGGNAGGGSTVVGSGRFRLPFNAAKEKSSGRSSVERIVEEDPPKKIKSLRVNQQQTAGCNDNSSSITQSSSKTPSSTATNASSQNNRAASRPNADNESKRGDDFSANASSVVGGAPYQDVSSSNSSDAEGSSSSSSGYDSEEESSCGSGEEDEVPGATDEPWRHRQQSSSQRSLITDISGHQSSIASERSITSWDQMEAGTLPASARSTTTREESTLSAYGSGHVRSHGNGSGGSDRGRRRRNNRRGHIRHHSKHSSLSSFAASLDDGERETVMVNNYRIPAEMAEYAIVNDLPSEDLQLLEDQVLADEEEEWRRRQYRLDLEEERGAEAKAKEDESGVVADGRSESEGCSRAGRLLGFRLRGQKRGDHCNKGGEEEARSGLYFRDGEDHQGRETFSSKSNAHPTPSFAGQENGGGCSSIVTNEEMDDNGSKSTNCTAKSGSVALLLPDSSSSYSARRSKYFSTIRHLTSIQQVNKRPLNVEDQELLRCVGLDTFVMLRFLRIGFDITFYPFLLACLILIPTYYTNPYEGTVNEDGSTVETGGYFRITMQRLEPGSPRLWVCFFFSVFYYLYVLRRIWIEWETFIGLRFDFLANGDEDMNRDKLHLKQYRTSCMVEYVPESHRRDKELYEFFDALFPGQVERAEVLLNASGLTKLIQERDMNIKRYEDAYAKLYHEKEVYRKRMEKQGMHNVGLFRYICCWCCGRAPKKPEDPKIRVGSGKCYCTKKQVKALPYYLSEIKRLNKLVEKEHRRILVEKMKVERMAKATSQNGFLKSNLQTGLRFVTGAAAANLLRANELTCDTGFVEFKTLTAKQSGEKGSKIGGRFDMCRSATCLDLGLRCITHAVPVVPCTNLKPAPAIQCNITGTTNVLLTSSAPDPRDLIWENSIVERSTIIVKNAQLGALLLTGTLFWSAVLSFISSISNINALGGVLPPWLIPEEGGFWHGLVQGYLPVLMLEGLMILLPIGFKLLARRYIQFKSNSEVDRFVFTWHFAYRLANLLIIIVAGSLFQTLETLRTNPQAVVNDLATGISTQSQFFLQNVIVAAGSETLWELAQMPTMLLHFAMHKFITVEAKSNRYLEKLEEPPSFEWGEYFPDFIFFFMVGVVYSTSVPIVMGACSVYFYIASKVYTHQALFVYAQSYEGGGKLMPLLNRTVFTSLYVGIIIFSTVLGLKQASFAGPLFLFFMFAVTLFVDKRIRKRFQEPSQTLALTKARVIDEETKRKEDRRNRYMDVKAAKNEKKRLVANPVKAQDEGTVDSAMEATSFGGLRNRGPSSQLSDAEGNGGTKPTQFHVVKEETVETLRARLAAKRSDQGLSKFGDTMSLTDLTKLFDDDSDDEHKQKFYQYRQPHLNKSIWETKPRPYR